MMAQARKCKPLTRKQLGLIHIAKTKLGYSDAEYRHTLLHFGGVESAKDLDQEAFDAIMGFYEYRGFAPVSPPPLKNAPGERDGMATPAQLDFIRDMWRRYTGEWDDGLAAWLEKSFDISDLRFLDADGASKAITALKRMTARTAKKPAKDRA